MGVRIDHEGPIHKQCIQYLQGRFPDAIVHHSPNEGNRGGRKGMIDGARRKAMGVLSGFPDIVFIHKGRTVFFEVKAEKGSLTKTQREFRDMSKKQGIPYYVIRSLKKLEDALDDLGEVNTMESKLRQAINLMTWARATVPANSECHDALKGFLDAFGGEYYGDVHLKAVADNARKVM